MAYYSVFEALGDPTRRLVFELLRQGPRSVAALADDLPVSRPAVSQHLKILKEAGLVTDEASGARRIYRVEDAGFADLRAWLDRIRDDALDAYNAEIQRQIDERRNT